MTAWVPRTSERTFTPNLPSPANTAWVVHAAAVCVGAIAAVNGWDLPFALAAIVAIVAGRARQFLAIASVLLFTVSFPPFSWPAWWICLAPLMWIWRDRATKLNKFQLAAEAVVIGFSIGWLSTGFVRAVLPSWGWLIHAVACLLFSLRVVAIAIAVRLTRNRPVVVSAFACSLAAVFAELFEAWCGGVLWAATNLALAVADKPLAQWAHWISPFGVSGLLYLANFLFVLDHASSGCRRWLGVLLAAAVLATAWAGGSWIQTAARTPLSFSVLLVQPHIRGGGVGQPWRPWLVLDRQTRRALADTGGVDLVVWPEASLSASWHVEPGAQVVDHSTRLTIADFANTLVPQYQTNCLVGAVMLERGTVDRYGLEVSEVRRYNCAYLVSRSGAIAHHKKLQLVPLLEGLPRPLDHVAIRRRVLPLIGLKAPLSPGREYRPLAFRDRAGNRHSIAVAVCYESFFPWLPQYHDQEVDAIVHLVYDGDTAAHPSVIERHVRACQYRAIETRKWNLVCSTWTGSAIIDPSGKIVAQLPTKAGVLASGVVPGSENAGY